MQRRLPEHLYKYQPFSTQALVNMKLRRVWFSRPSAFNDPLDCALGVRWEDVTRAEVKQLWDELCIRHRITEAGARAAGYLDEAGQLTDKVRRDIFAGAETTRSCGRTMVAGIVGFAWSLILLPIGSRRLIPFDMRTSSLP